MDDLVRMAFFSAARNNGLNFLAFTRKSDKKWYIGFLTGVAGYFDLRGVPMFFFVKLDQNQRKIISFNILQKKKKNGITQNLLRNQQNGITYQLSNLQTNQISSSNSFIDQGIGNL